MIQERQYYFYDIEFRDDLAYVNKLNKAVYFRSAAVFIFDLFKKENVG